MAHKTATASARELSKDMVDKLKYNAVGILSETRRTILNRFPFFGAVGMSLDLIPTRDPRLETMATDGKSLYCDIDFLSTLSNDDKMFIVAHEILHCIMAHMLRKETREQELFNYAADMEVNNILREEGFAVPKDAVLPEKHGLAKGLSAEEYYDKLMDRQAKPNDKQYDSHFYHNESSNNSIQEGLQDRYGKIHEDQDYAPNVQKSSIERIREAAIIASQEISRNGESVSSNVDKLVKALLNPKVCWKDLLASFVSSKVHGSEATWQSCNRRFMHSKTYLPSHVQEFMDIAVIMDTSGSVAETLPKFLTELRGLVSQFKHRLTLIQCDSSVKDVREYDNDNQIDFDGFKTYGYGGTDMQPGFDYLVKALDDGKLDKIDCCIVLTDGEFYKVPTDPARYPVMWCVTKDGNKDKIKFGNIADLD